MFDFLSNCLCEESNRHTSEELLQHRFIQKYKDVALDTVFSTPSGDITIHNDHVMALFGSNTQRCIYSDASIPAHLEWGPSESVDQQQKNTNNAKKFQLGITATTATTPHVKEASNTMGVSSARVAGAAPAGGTET